MHLSKYLTGTGTSLSDFAERMGVSHSAVSRWVSGKRLPSRSKMAEIQKATDGAVTPNDFFASPEAPSEAAA